MCQTPRRIQILQEIGPKKEESMKDQQKALAGQVAIVTGGGRGIGAAIAQKLAQMGAQLVICGRSQAPLDETASVIRKAGGGCEAIRCDVSSLPEVEAAASRVEKTFG